MNQVGPTPTWFGRPKECFGGSFGATKFDFSLQVGQQDLTTIMNSDGSCHRHLMYGRKCGQDN